MVVKSGNELLNEESQKYTTDRCQVEVVDYERDLKLEGWAVSHEFPATKNDDVVCQDRKSGLFHSRHRCHSWLEVEILGMEARNGRESLVKDRPKFDTEWAIDGRQRQRLENIGRGSRSHCDAVVFAMRRAT